MGLGSTNVNLLGVWQETNVGLSGSDNYLGAYGVYSYPQGPGPHGDGSVGFYGSGLKTGVQQDILYNPVNNGASAAGSTTNYKMSYYKNYYGYMDGTNYFVEMYIENNLPAAGRGDPPNDVLVDMYMNDYNDVNTTHLCPLDGNAAENGGTYGQALKSNSDTFNVNYMWVYGGLSCQGLANYDLNILVNGSSVYSNTGLNGVTTMINNSSGSDWSSTPTNGGAGVGFSIEYYFS